MTASYNPSLLLLAVMRVLGEHGLSTVVDADNAPRAVAAAAELLRALGVEPLAPQGGTPVSVGTATG